MNPINSMSNIIDPTQFLLVDDQVTKLPLSQIIGETPSPSYPLNRPIFINAVHIHYPDPHARPTGSDPIAKIIVEGIQRVTNGIQSLFANEKAAAQGQNQQTTVKAAHTESIQNPSKQVLLKQKRADLIQKIVIFALGLFIGGALASGALLGTKSFITAAVAISAAVGFVKCSHAIITEVAKVIRVAKEVWDLLLEVS